MAHAPRGVGHAAGRPVRDLDALPGPGEQHRVIADDVAAAHGGEADRSRLAFPGVAFAGIHRDVRQILPSAPAMVSPIFSAVPDGASTVCR